MFPIGVQLYSVRDFAEKDMYGTLKEVKAMGYDGVEFAGLFGHSAEEIKGWCEELGLIPVSAHVSMAEMLADPDGVFDAYKTIGCNYIAIPSLPLEKRPGAECFDRALTDMAILGEKAKLHGLQLLYHNHNFEFDKVNGRYGYEIIFDTVPASLLKTEQDTCWVNVGGEDPAAYLLKYSGRAPVVHLKDFIMRDRQCKTGLYELIGEKNTEEKAGEDSFALRPAGYGCQDFPAIFEAAKKAGTEWFILEEDSPAFGWSSMECIRKSVEYLKSINK